MEGQSARRRETVQRRAILEALRATKTHPTAEELLKRVRRKVPSVSLATIYRNLRRLAEEGLIQELCYGPHKSRFDGNPELHYHFSCVNCGRVFDVPMSVKRRLDAEASKVTGFKVLGHRLEFYGICDKCQGGSAEK